MIKLLLQCLFCMREYKLTILPFHSQVHPSVWLVLHHLFASLYLKSPQDLTRVILHHLLGGVACLSEFPVETWYWCSCYTMPATQLWHSEYILPAIILHPAVMHRISLRGFYAQLAPWILPGGIDLSSCCSCAQNLLSCCYHMNDIQYI